MAKYSSFFPINGLLKPRVTYLSLIQTCKHESVLFVFKGILAFGYQDRCQTSH